MSQRKLIFTSALSVLITALLFASVSFIPAPKRSSYGASHPKNQKPLPDPSSTQWGFQQQHRFNYFLTDKGETLIQTQLIQPLQEKLLIHHTPKMFSRCPSGIGYVIHQSPDNDEEYYIGIVENFLGCKGEEVCTFRLNAQEETLEVMNVLTGNYTSTSQWLKDNSAALSLHE